MPDYFSNRPNTPTSTGDTLRCLMNPSGNRERVTGPQMNGFITWVRKVTQNAENVLLAVEGTLPLFFIPVPAFQSPNMRCHGAVRRWRNELTVIARSTPKCFPVGMRAVPTSSRSRPLARPRLPIPAGSPLPSAAWLPGSWSSTGGCRRTRSPRSYTTRRSPNSGWCAARSRGRGGPGTDPGRARSSATSADSPSACARSASSCA